MTTPETGSRPSFYESLGGAPAVQVAVERFYQRVLDDPQLAPYFDGVDMPRLKRHQSLVIGNLLGGPAAYDGIGLAAAHAPLAIDDEDYDRVGTHLLTVLGELGAGDDAARAVSGALADVRPQIVTVPTLRADLTSRPERAPAEEAARAPPQVRGGALDRRAGRDQYPPVSFSRSAASASSEASVPSTTGASDE